MPSPARPKPAPRPARRRPEDARRACKPDFVHRLRGWMTIPLVRPLPDGSSCLPGSAGARWPCGLRRARSLFGIAPGGACHAGAVASPPVGSYPTVSPLPIRRQAVCSLWRYPWGCPRRALPGTITSWSPDFPRQVALPRSSSPPRAVGMAGIGRRVNGRFWGVERARSCGQQAGRDAPVFLGFGAMRPGAEPQAEGRQTLGGFDIGIADAGQAFRQGQGGAATI